MAFETEYVEGMQFDRGYTSAYFVTDTNRMEAVLEDPYILITDKKICAIADMLPALEKVLQTGKKDILIIAEDVDGEALATLVVNKLRGIVNVLAVKAPGLRRSAQGDAARHRHPDRWHGHQRGGRPQARLGRARRPRAARAASSPPRTTRPSSRAQATRPQIDGRMKQIKAQIEETTSDYDKEKLQERLAKLAGGVAIIKVGAGTEVELKEKKHRVEDALSATRSAVEEGIVPGGGVALINAQTALDKLKLEGDAQTGVEHRAAGARGAAAPARRERRPRRQRRARERPPRARPRRRATTLGYNVMTGEYVDMLSAASSTRPR